jgi:hypothetical protein
MLRNENAGGAAGPCMHTYVYVCMCMHVAQLFDALRSGNDVMLRNKNAGGAAGICIHACVYVCMCVYACGTST